jgi:hypothetical protein
MKVLVFGDSNADDYFRCADGGGDPERSVSIDYNPGLTYFANKDHYRFLLETALQEDAYDTIVISCHTNDLAHGCTKEQLHQSEKEVLAFVRRYEHFSGQVPSRVLFVGPEASHINTALMSKRADNTHLDDTSRQDIGLLLLAHLNMM